MSNHDYEGVLELFADGYISEKHSLAFTINYDFTDAQEQTRDDPYWPAEASVNSVEIRRNGEKVECPRWLEEIILDAISEDVLIEHAAEQTEPAI